MARNIWLLDSRHIASKIKNVTQSFNQKEQSWKNSTTRSCPNCNHQIDNCVVAEKWPGFPIGVKFDPSDQQLLEHLAAKLGVVIDKPHPFIDQFIPTLEEEDGICYTHPEKLPGVKQDGSIAHFFYRTANAYSTGTRRRRKVHCWTDQVGGYVRWHKTGKTRPVIVNGIQKGFKKIMVLYLTTTKGEKPEKTNWVMHQYHLGIEEDEKNSEFVVSKVFYQQQYRECNNSEQEVPQEAREISISNGDSVTPKTTTPELSRPAKRHKDLDTIPEGLLDCIDNPDPETPGTDDLIPSLSEHGRIGVEEEDLHEHDASDALADIELDTPPELQNIDLQSSSLESLLDWVRGKTD